MYLTSSSPVAARSYSAGLRRNRADRMIGRRASCLQIMSPRSPVSDRGINERAEKLVRYSVSLLAKAPLLLVALLLNYLLTDEVEISIGAIVFIIQCIV